MALFEYQGGYNLLHNGEIKTHYTFKEAAYGARMKEISKGREGDWNSVDRSKEWTIQDVRVPYGLSLKINDNTEIGLAPAKRYHNGSDITGYIEIAIDCGECVYAVLSIEQAENVYAILGELLEK